VISLLNCLGEVVEKVAAEAISIFCEAAGVLHPGQTGSPKQQRSTIDAVACLIQDVHQAWDQKLLLASLFIDVKGAFDHVVAARLVKRIQVAAVQAVALYGAELWWQGQKDQRQNIQLMINRQAHVHRHV
jgi:hypothetical protein